MKILMNKYAPDEMVTFHIGGKEYGLIEKEKGVNFMKPEYVEFRTYKRKHITLGRTTIELAIRDYLVKQQMIAPDSRVNCFFIIDESLGLEQVDVSSEVLYHTEVHQEYD